MRGIVLSLLVMLLWGSLFPVVKLGYGAYGVISTADILLFAGIRFTVCGGVICLYQARRNRESYMGIKDCLPLVLLAGLFAVILHYSFTYVGLSLTDGSKTALLKQAGVLFYVCFSSMFFKDDKLTVKKLFGVLLGLGGIFVINSDAAGVRFGVGEILILAASFCTVFSNVVSKRAFVRQANPVTVTGVSQLFGGLVLLIAGWCLGGKVSYTWSPSLWIMVYICAASIISYCIWFSIVKRGALSNLFIIKFAEPMFAAIFSAFLVGENIWTIQYLLAFLLVGAGIVISNQK